MRRDSRWFDRGFALATGLAALLSVLALGAVVGTILWRGLPALQVEFLLHPTQSAGAAGGVLYQLLGTCILMVTSAVVATPLAIALALTIGYYGEGKRRSRWLESSLYLWASLPSILLGILGFFLFVVVLAWGKSWLAGGILLGLLIVPTVAIALLERLRAIPRAQREAAAALGLRPSQVVRSVLLPQSRSGLWTGLLLGLGRAAGETAPILFTAAVFSGVSWPQGVRDNPVLALPYHIFVLAQDSLDPAVRPRVWGAALVLLGFSLGLSLLTLPLRLRSHEEGRDG